MAEILRYLLIPVFINLVAGSIPNECIQKSPCVCEFTEYAKYDLTNLLEALPNSTEFSLKTYFGGSIFGFNGCSDKLFNIYNLTTGDKITEGKATLVAQYPHSIKGANNTYKNFTETTVLGVSSQIVFNKVKASSSDYELIFKSGQNVAATIRLLCDDINEPFITALKNSSSTQNLVLGSPHACIKFDHPGLSNGSILIILSIVALAIYFIGGGLILYFIRGARGIELIPNIDFWRELPGLVKDGVIFLFSGCNSAALTTPDSYDRI